MGMELVIMLIINLLGGAAVIGSYIFGLKGKSGAAGVLWGGVPAGVRSLYTASMLVATAGYFAVLYHIYFRLVPDQVTIFGVGGYAVLYVIFALIMVASALWMPLTRMYVANPGAGLWTAIRTVLFIVGLASVALVIALIAMVGKVTGLPYWLAVIGSAYFAFHTLILDGIIWAALFGRSA